MKLSIIIPIYNVETTLKRCLDSIISQDMTTCEIYLLMMVQLIIVETLPKITLAIMPTYIITKKTMAVFPMHATGV